MKKNWLLIAGIIVLSACSSTDNQDKNGEVVSAIASGGEEDRELMRENEKAIAEEEARQREEEKNVTTLKFDKEVHDFGEVASGSENHCEFRVTNTGDKPLTIVNVGASCGCTTPKKPEKPIQPGKSDVIEVTFKPTGSGPTEKTVTVQANTNPRVSVVKVKASVK